MDGTRIPAAAERAELVGLEDVEVPVEIEIALDEGRRPRHTVRGARAIAEERARGRRDRRRPGPGVLVVVEGEIPAIEEPDGRPEVQVVDVDRIEAALDPGQLAVAFLVASVLQSDLVLRTAAAWRRRKRIPTRTRRGRATPGPPSSGHAGLALGDRGGRGAARATRTPRRAPGRRRAQRPSRARAATRGRP